MGRRVTTGIDRGYTRVGVTRISRQHRPQGHTAGVLLVIIVDDVLGQSRRRFAKDRGIDPGFLG